MKKLTLILLFIITVLELHSQDEIAPADTFTPGRNIGLGGGIDYGGFGGRLTFVPSERVEFFGALGYNLLGVGLNAGVDFRLQPRSRICPYLGVMYGYNAVIKIKGAEMYNQTYYGPSFNFGLEFWSAKRPNFFNLELIVPIRSTEYHSDIRNLKNNPLIVFSSEPIPIAISIGYHFAL
jgi:hypothetical protein